jgi:hypothetical protein
VRCRLVRIVLRYSRRCKMQDSGIALRHTALAELDKKHLVKPPKKA